ncbi:serine/threonine-protein kinase [Saccharopolyspora gregorii]|uniref:non-specific serine/threonine protein kinase n=1 Tax=Saccharopolyspora gregorii TaxID=33914 RepID=A0ABP6RXN2_9PSEU|nr:serine/threonine-protein kinase [Saccharopolyspora gregorii]
MPTTEEEAAAGADRLIADRYRLEQRIGGGAMGIVWAGTDELLRRPVAVKEVLLPRGMPEGEAAELRERALREARAIALVTHPNVVTLYDVARHEGEPFVVMELVPSQSLAAVLAEHGALGDPQLALVADGVAAALDAAHRAGIVHRDVKPGNVLIGDDGRIKLSDFGISRNVSEHTITSTGIMLGTPAFIAPEIASGEAVTDAADLWGLGATLFAASEGTAPYGANDDPLATITSVVRGPVPAPHRPGPIGEIIAGLMVKDPAQRMTAQEVRRHVQDLLPPSGTRPFEMLLDPEAPTVRVRKVPSTSPNTAPGTATDEEPAPLAADPGPLPFMLSEPPPAPRRRFRWGAVVLGLAAVVLFAASTAGGFAATRALAGHDVLPEITTPAPSQPATPRLARYVDEAKRSQQGGGGFEVVAPEGWDVFRGSRNQPTESMVVYLISPDGRAEVAVERFEGYYGDRSTAQDYVDVLQERSAGEHGTFRLEEDRPTGATDEVSGETDRFLRYTASQGGVIGPAVADSERSTTSQLMPRGSDLWVLRVTTPLDQPGAHQRLFDEALGGFQITS